MNKTLSEKRLSPLKTTRLSSRTKVQLQTPSTPRMPTLIKRVKTTNVGSHLKKLPSESRTEANLTRLSQLSFGPTSPSSRYKSITIERAPVKRFTVQPIITHSITQFPGPRAKKLQVFWLSTQCSGHIASAREDSQVLVHNHLLYLYGGQSTMKHKDVRVLNLQNFSWGVLDTHDSPSGRLGHSLVAFSDTLYVFGGWVNKQASQSCTNKLFAFDCTSSQWTKLITGGVPIQPRRHHASVCIGKEMVVYGGVNIAGERLQDTSVFDFNSRIWKSLTLSDSPGPRSHFTFVASNNGSAYLFGGLTATNEPSNELHLFTVKNNSSSWTKAQVIGNPPCPRYSHAAAMITECMYVFGGRAADSSALGDLHVFSMREQQWTEVIIHGKAPPARWGHSMDVHGTRILVLGGLSGNSFMSSHVFELETRPQKVEMMLESYGKADTSRR